MADANAMVGTDSITFDITANSAVCFAAIIAVQQLSVIVGDSKPLLSICPAPESNDTQFVRIFHSYARLHPEELHQSFMYVALRSLQQAFFVQLRRVEEVA